MNASEQRDCIFSHSDAVAEVLGTQLSALSFLTVMFEIATSDVTSSDPLYHIGRAVVFNGAKGWVRYYRKPSLTPTATPT